MDQADYKQLELLLGKLRIELDKRYCILPGVVADGYHIALYDGGGEVCASATDATIEKVVEKLKREVIEQDL